MKGALILAHGSRRKETEETLNQIAQKVKAILGVVELETAFLQFSERSLAVGLGALVARGCDEIAVTPYFLFDGVHIKEDIPGEIAAFCAEHEGVKVTLGRTLGAEDTLARLVAQRIDEAFNG